MGVKGPSPKPPGRLVGHRKKRQLVLLPTTTPAADAIPEPLPHWLRLTRQRWAEFWSDPVSLLVADRCRVDRLFEYLDEHERSWRVYRKERVVLGSKGQVRISPVGDFALRLEDKIQALEDSLGLSPAARYRLGILVGSAARSLQELNADIEAQAADQPDPRLDLLAEDAKGTWPGSRPR